MIKRYAVSFLVFFCFLSTQGRTLTFEEMLKELQQAQTKDGIQVGILIDLQTSGSDHQSKLYMEVVTLTNQDNNVVFEVLQKSNAGLVYGGKHVIDDPDNPGARILSLREVHSLRWFVYSSKISDCTVKWISAPKGISSLRVKDGDLIGFAIGAWRAPRIYSCR